MAAHEAVWRAFDRGEPSTLAVLPTGTGKTLLAAMAATTARDRGLRTLFLAHREILVDQARRTLEACGLDVAVEMGEQDARAHAAMLGDADVVVGTVQTMQGHRRARWDPRHFGLIVTDECHRAAAPGHRSIYDWFSASHLGITATPDGASGKIGNVFGSLAYHYPMRQAVLDGYLVPIVHERCKVAVDLKGLKITGGDYNGGDLAERISPQVEYLADAIKQRIGARPSVVFTPTVASALAMATALGHESPSGPAIGAHYVAGGDGAYGMDRGKRREILDLYERRQFQVLCCCDLLFEGWDAPHLGAVVIARPTLVRYRYAQMVGRGTRLCGGSGKRDCLVVDFDWKTDGAARDLMTPVDLFAEDDPELAALGAPARRGVLEHARRLMEGGEADPLAALDRAREASVRRQSLPLVLTGIRADFEVEARDPLAVAELAGVKLRGRTEVWSPGSRYEPAREWQEARLAGMGVRDPGRLTYFGAQKLIRALERRKEQGLASVGQVRELLRLGVGEVTSRAMTSGQASRVIDELRTYRPDGASPPST